MLRPRSSGSRPGRWPWGARSFAGIGAWGADAPPQVLADLGARRDAASGGYRIPEETTFRRVPAAVDADAVDRVVGARLSARARGRAGPTRPPGRRGRQDPLLAYDHCAVCSTGSFAPVIATDAKRVGAALTCCARRVCPR